MHAKLQHIKNIVNRSPWISTNSDIHGHQFISMPITLQFNEIIMYNNNNKLCHLAQQNTPSCVPWYCSISHSVNVTILQYTPTLNLVWLLVHQHTWLNCKELSGIESIEMTNIQWSFQPSLWPWCHHDVTLMMYHQNKFDCNNSKDDDSKKKSHFDYNSLHCDLNLEDSNLTVLHNTSSSTTITNLVTNGWVAQNISSGQSPDTWWDGCSQTKAWWFQYTPSPHCVMFCCIYLNADTKKKKKHLLLYHTLTHHAPKPNGTGSVALCDKYLIKN